MGKPGIMRSRTRAGRGFPIALAMALLVGGCDNVETSTSDITPVDIWGTTVEVVDGRVESACFSFEMPEGYEINPNSESCVTVVRMIDTDSLTDIHVEALREGVSVEEAFDRIEGLAADGGLGEVELEYLTIAGIPSGVAYVNNSLGIPIAYYYVPIEAGHFTDGGEPVTALSISGPVGGPEFRDAIEGIADSLDLNF